MGSDRHNGSAPRLRHGATSDIVAARMVGPYAAVWTSTELFVGTFVGDPSQTWRFDRIAGASGAVALNAVVVVDGTAYWLTPELVFKAWAPGSEPQSLACPLANHFRGNFPTTASVIAKTFAAHVARFNEVWFGYANPGPAPYRGSYVAFSLTDGKWFKGEVGRTAMHQGLSGLLAGINGGQIVNCETGARFGYNLTQDGSGWRIRSSDISLDPAGQRRMMIRGVRPDLGQDSNDIFMTVRAKDYPQQDYRETTLVLASGALKKDFRASGRLVSIEFVGVDDGFGTYGSQGVPVFDIAPMGER